MRVGALKSRRHIGLSSACLAAISWTEAVTGLASVVEAEDARLVAVRVRRDAIGELGVALLVDEASDVEASSQSARFPDQREVVRGEVGEDERAVAGQTPLPSEVIPQPTSSSAPRKALGSAGRAV